ncbi:hypothetical protein [Pseudomonas sp. 58 R 3]|nr:hypothetical protein [Pseudomonas sp. 58 R 3]
MRLQGTPALPVGESCCCKETTLSLLFKGSDLKPMLTEAIANQCSIILFKVQGVYWLAERVERQANGRQKLLPVGWACNPDVDAFDDWWALARNELGGEEFGEHFAPKAWLAKVDPFVVDRLEGMFYFSFQTLLLTVLARVDILSKQFVLHHGVHVRVTSWPLVAAAEHFDLLASPVNKGQPSFLAAAITLTLDLFAPDHLDSGGCTQKQKKTPKRLFLKSQAKKKPLVRVAFSLHLERETGFLLNVYPIENVELLSSTTLSMDRIMDYFLGHDKPVNRAAYCIGRSHHLRHFKRHRKAQLTG